MTKGIIGRAMIKASYEPERMRKYFSGEQINIHVFTELVHRLSDGEVLQGDMALLWFSHCLSENLKDSIGVPLCHFIKEDILDIMTPKSVFILLDSSLHLQEYRIQVFENEKPPNADPEVWRQRRHRTRPMEDQLKEIPQGTEYSANRYDNEYSRVLHVYDKNGNSYDLISPIEDKLEPYPPCPKCKEPNFRWICNHCQYEDKKVTNAGNKARSKARRG